MVQRKRSLKIDQEDAGSEIERMDFQGIVERMLLGSIKLALLYNQMRREEQEEEEGKSLDDKMETRIELRLEVDTGGTTSQLVVLQLWVNIGGARQRQDQ